MKSRLKDVRITPRKIGLAAKLVRNKDALKASALLQFSFKKSAKILGKALDSAIANAKVKGKKAEDLKIEEIVVGPGKTFKRFKPVSHGSANKILKRTSNVLILLSEKTKKEDKQKDIKEKGDKTNG